MRLSEFWIAMGDEFGDAYGRTLVNDLVLTDLQMPNMGGYALTKAIKADPTLTHIPVLILSSSSTDEDRQRGLDAGASGYLEKGEFDEASLLSTVSRLLGADA